MVDCFSEKLRVEIATQELSWELSETKPICRLCSKVSCWICASHGGNLEKCQYLFPGHGHHMGESDFIRICCIVGKHSAPLPQLSKQSFQFIVSTISRIALACSPTEQQASQTANSWFPSI